MLDAIAEELGRALERAALLESERDARLQAELLERNAARLAAATTDEEVAASTVAEIEEFGADVVFVWSARRPASLETLASSDVPQETRDRFGMYPLELGGARLGCDADEEPRRGRVGRRVRRPLPRAGGGAAPAGRRVARRHCRCARERGGDRRDLRGLAERRWVNEDRRPLLLGIAEQIGVALERAQLQAEAERTAAASSFLALVGESLERVTTVSVRARRLVEVADRGARDLRGGPPRRRGRRGRRRSRVAARGRRSSRTTTAGPTGSRGRSPPGGRRARPTRRATPAPGFRPCSCCRSARGGTASAR